MSSGGNGVHDAGSSVGATAPVKDKRLPHNCEACRKARTKCDKTWPKCRRCQRLGLTCSWENKPKRGRPRVEKQEVQKKERRTRRKKKWTPCTIIKRAIVTVMKEGGDHNKYKPAIVAQIKCWLWVSLVRKSVFLMEQVLELCKACKIDYFAMLSAAFEASLKAREGDDFMHPKFWQPREGGLSQADCAAMIPEDHLDAWKEVSEGNACVIVRCVYFGRGFYFSNKEMETRIMSAAQANLLWSENKRDFFTALFRETCSDFLMSLARANVSASHKMRRFHKGMPPEGVAALEGTFTFQNIRILEADYLREGTEAENRYDVACEIYTSACGSFRQLVLRLTPEASPEVRTSDNRAQYDMEEEGEDFDALLNEIFKG